MTQARTLEYRRTRGGKTIISRLPLHEEVADYLREMIVSGDLIAGERLHLNELAEALGVSLTPLREAIKVLAAERLVDLKPNRGARVAPLRVDETRALFEVMSGIEALAAELACERMTPEQLDALEDRHAAMREHFERGEKAAYFNLNRQIHDMIVEFAGNPILIHTRAQLAVRAERARRLSVEAGRQRAMALDDHDELMVALRGRDAVTARRVWRRHLLRSGEETCEVLRARHVP